MAWSGIVFSSALFLCGFSSPLPAQTQTTINARGEARTAPIHAQGGGWSASVDRNTMQAVFTVNQQDLAAGRSVDYELLVTNTGSNAVKIPRTLEWKDVDSGGSDQRYTEGKVVFELSTKDRFTPMSPTLNLYSVGEKPSTQLDLEPGDSIRILGTMSLPAMAFNPNWIGQATLTAHFCVSSIEFALSEGAHKKTEKNQMLWCVSADPKYEVNLPEH